jgi:alanine dehydrogenase
LNIGVAKEIKSDEYRVALTPAGARELGQRGHEVIVETGAGDGSSFSDATYEAAGARIASVDEVWADAELLLKVKEPIEPEYGRLREGLVLFTYLHIAADEPLTRALLDSGIRAVAYETVETDSRALPLLAPMSEIAGRLAAQAGAYFLEKPLGGRGLLLGGVPGVAPGRVVVIGGGMVGYNAAVIAIGLGAHVTILERSIDRMRHLEEILSGRVSLVMSSTLQIEESVSEADVVIGAVLIPGAVAPKLITHEMVAGMKEGAVLADVAIDQGGCAETSHPTTHSEHAWRGSDHVDQGSDQRNAAVRRGDRYVRACRSCRPRSSARPRCEHGRRQAHLRSRRRGARDRVPAARRRAVCSRGLSGRLLRGREPHDEPRDRRSQADHEGAEHDHAEQSEDVHHRRPRIAACRGRV